MKTSIIILLIILALIIGLIIGIAIAYNLKTCGCELQQIGNLSICIGK